MAQKISRAADAHFRLKPVCRLGLLLAAGSSLSAGLAHAAENAQGLSPATSPTLLAQIVGAEAEGEVAVADVMSSDAAYLAQLALMRGHLHIGVALYRQGHVEAAATHMKHPGDELYAGLVPAFKARDVEGFDKALTALTTAVSDGADIATVEEALAEVELGIERARAGVPARERMDAVTQFRVIVRLMRTAAEEYAIAVVDGRVENAHEYQDALGFVRIAREHVERLAEDPEQTGREGVSEAIRTAREQLDAIDDLWVGLMPPDELDRSAERLYGATARVELAASAIE